MGVTSSKLEKALSEFPETERYFGLENFGNTCYANSVLQSLYFCQPFRRRVLEYAQSSSYKESEENLLTCLADLFVQIQSQKRKTGIIAPKRFVQRLKRDNELFRSYMHQDAHEFLNYLLNECSELLEKEAKARAAREDASGQVSSSSAAAPAQQQSEGQSAEPEQGSSQQQSQAAPATWVHELFQGFMLNETKCLECETVTSREEAFYDLSLEIEQNCSLTACLRNFSATETLDADDKFFCDKCKSLQDAQKVMKIRALPRVLCLHLKRFKYIEQLDRMRKLVYRVVFPFELKLRNTSEDCAHVDDAYQLFAVVVHVGSGPNHGHYVSFVKSAEHWLFFDDDMVEPMSEQQVHLAFGSTQEYSNTMEHGYILMYERQPCNGAC